MGVWIETKARSIKNLSKGSHPAWVCGLKPENEIQQGLLFVTPCVGVWIETDDCAAIYSVAAVTPCVGVWIETKRVYIRWANENSHTLRGCVD